MQTTTMLRSALVLAAAFGAAGAARAQAEIKVSYQPALYWALPFYVATEKGWWAEVGLKPVFSTFPAGVPQIAASASKSWDVGGTGSVPAVLGHVRFGIKTIGITNDESAGNALLARKDLSDKFARDPAAIKGQTIVLTANSTGDYAVQSCLKKWGITKADVTIKNMGQAEIISAMSSNNADLGGLWAPNIYTLEEKAGAKVLCSGKEGGVAVPGALIARGEYAEQNPENVAKFLAVYLRAWK
jgi:ABC-type nitrate/sulfonate/bicarbonate transport system substrate-binding protein